MTDSGLPPALIEAIRDQRAILFLGAGASLGARSSREADIPGTDDLRQSVAEKFLGGQLRDKPLQEVISFAVNESSLLEFQTFIRSIFIDFSPAAFHMAIPEFQWRAIVTTNIDLIVERAFSTSRSTQGSLVKFVKDGQLIDQEMRRTVRGIPYLKLHGCIDYYTDLSIPFILSTDQYAIFSQNRKRLYNHLQSLGYEYPLIFCGYSLSDPHIQTILFDLSNPEIPRPMYYLVRPALSDIEQRYWSARRVACIPTTFSNFLDQLRHALSDQERALSRAIGGGSASIRTHYRYPNVTEGAEVLTFLQDDVDHVRRDMPIEGYSAPAFYRGVDLGWAATAASLDVRRRVEDTVLVDAVLPEEHERTDPVELFVLKGPAGNGKTVLLKRVAWEAATEYGRLVLYLKPAGALRFAALAEISSYTQERIYLVVDRAAVHATELRSLVEFARAKDIKLTVLTGERDHEWNVRCSELDEYVTQDYPVRYLSEREIHDLLAKLDQHGALGLLADSPYEQRVAAFLERAQRQLLVALHETTLGKRFEEIVVDEYERITPAVAKQLYLDVCTLNRLGAGVRAGLIARVSGIDFTQFREKFLLPLDFVVQSYEDPYIGDHLYKARHPHVAELVFANVLTNPEDRFDQVVQILHAMNIDYSSDLEAFRQLIQGRKVADTFQSQELGRRFYEVAHERVGDNAHLFHQQAVFEMQHPGGSLTLAETAWSKAHALAPYDKAIQHTGAALAREQALATQNPLKREALRKSALQQVASLTLSDAKSAYGFHTAAMVRLDEMREILDADGGSEGGSERLIVELSRDIERSVNAGLQKFPDDIHLLATEAKYRDLIHEHGRAERALRQAFEKNPRTDWIAARLAARYVQEGKIERARDVLAQCLEVNPGSKVAHLAMAKLLDRYGAADRKMVLEHLARSFSEGDANYDARFWYARELFLTARFDEADRLFSALKHTPVSPSARNLVRGIVQDGAGKAIKYNGVVVKREETYVFVHADEFQRDLFGHSSATSEGTWSKLQRGTRVSFELGFNMRGPAIGSIMTEETGLGASDSDLGVRH